MRASGTLLGGVSTGGKTIDRIKEWIRYALAWVSFWFALAGGASMSSTFLGDWIVWVIKHLDGLLALIPHVPRGMLAFPLLVALVITILVDIYVDAEPNMFAVSAATGLSAVARAVPGGLAGKVTDLSHRALDAVNSVLGEWIGTTAALTVGVALIIAALIIARRIVAGR